MSKKWLNPVVLVTAILLFVHGRWEYLSLPYFWDEMGVYAFGALEMSQQGLGLLPASLDPDLSRGHPLLFYFLAALNFKLFGTSLLAGHGFAMFWTLLLVVSVYFIGTRTFNARIGLVAGLIIAAQQVVQAQATLLLPEVMLAFFILWGWYGYISQRYWLYFVAGTCAILVKETGVFLPMIFGLHLIWQMYLGDWGQWSWKKVVVILSPVGMLMLYLAIQYQQMGWVIFPYHSGILTMDSDTYFNNLGVYLSFLFVEQGRWLLSIMLLIAITRVIRLEGKVPEVLKQVGWLMVSLLLLSFFGVYLDRYLMYFFPFIAIFGGWAAFYLSREQNPRLIPATVVLVVGFTFFGSVNEWNYDAQPNYIHQTTVTKQAIDHIRPVMQEEAVYGNFPLNRAVTRPEFGYVDDTLLRFDHLYKESIQKFLIADPGGSHGIDLSMLRPIKEFKSGWAKVGLYERKGNK